MACEQSNDEGQLRHFKYSKRFVLSTILNRPDGGMGLIGQRVVVGGWVKSSRERKLEPNVRAPDPGVPKDVKCVEVLHARMPFLRAILKVFGGGGDHHVREKSDDVTRPTPPQPLISLLQISDGSCVASLRVVVDSTLAPPGQVMPTGTCVLAQGILQKHPLKDKETIELKAEEILHIGTIDHAGYPLSKKRLNLENLRDSAHLRQRTRTVASIMRIRNALTQATHTFFQENGFLYVQVPIITTTNYEGPSENIFQVTTLLDHHHREKTDDQIRDVDFDNVKLEDIKSSIQEKIKKVEELKRNDSNKEALAAAARDLKKTNELVLYLEAKEKRKTGKSTDDIFSCKTYLTFSGRMHLESYASALGNVYSFGPRFRANRYDSKRFLAEMWMAELEMAFSELEDAMECAVDFLKFVCKWILDKCREDLTFVSKRVDKLVQDRLQLILAGSFEKISYTKVIEDLKQVTKRKFQTEVQWGVPLNEEHESYLTDEIYKKPLIICNHPREVKSFNLRLNDDGKTAASFDIIVPEVGILIRGSQSEERFSMLTTRIKELGLEKKRYEWYLDLRKHGNAKCCGFSFMLDPLVLYATGLNDVRDVVPFPLSFGKANN
ncbi:hypothetical protein OROGR_024694 [Orobanche gracilis]